MAYDYERDLKSKSTSIDLDLGFYQIAKHYYFPGWHQPASALELMINLDKWNA